jgi:hypothetical protein
MSLSGQVLAKTWPLYLNSDTRGLSPYWRKIEKGIIERLSGTLTIKDQTGQVRRPKDLMFLDWACDPNGEPMFGSKNNYISKDYPETVREAISWLGVTTPTWDWVCDQLKDLYKKGLLHSKMRNAQWCSDLARVILKSVHRDDAKYARDLKDIPLIPLSDGTWRSALSKDNPIYFPASRGVNIPPGLPLSLVEANACTCPLRKNLFLVLGVKDCDVPSVVERIIAYHTKLKSAKVHEIIAQLKYLYQKKEHLRDGDMDKIYLVCAPPDLTLRKGTSIYADISSDGELQQLFSGCSDIWFLHKDYFKDLSPLERAEFAEWLHQAAGVALVPRFIEASFHGMAGMHADFKWLLANKSNQVLTTLRKHWNIYGKIITSRAKDTLANHEFLCQSGSTAVLKHTCIPFGTWVERTEKYCEASECDFIDLPSGDPEDWKFLSNLGIDLDDGLPYYLWVLSQLGFLINADAEKSKKLCWEIQSRAFSPFEKYVVK